ncbi:hypothetical protein D3C80_2001760 [compost metagenome]
MAEAAARPSPVATPARRERRVAVEVTMAKFGPGVMTLRIRTPEMASNAPR